MDPHLVLLGIEYRYSTYHVKDLSEPQRMKYCPFL